MSKVLGASVAVIVFAAAHVAPAAEFEVHPSLAVGEEYTDNVFGATTNRVSDYITRVLPGIVMSYRAPALTGDLSYVFDYRYYARDTHKDETTHSLTAKGKLTAVENLLFLEVSDEYQRVSLDATRDVTRESLFANQSDRNVATVSPYLTLRVSERIPVKAGYRFIDTRYFDSVGIDKIDHIAFLDIAYELSKRWSLTASYTFTRELADIDNYSQHQALGGFRYEYADKSFLFAQAGNAWTRYDSGHSLSSLNWNAGITHVFDAVTGTASTGVRYNEDPLSNVIKESFVSASIEKRLDRGSLSFSPTYSVFDPIVTDSIKTKKYAAAVRGQYEFTSYLKGNLAFIAEKYEQQTMESYTRRIQVDSGLGYLLAKDLTVSLTYIYTGYYSPEIISDNWHVNRLMVEIKKTF